jgi:probable selenium-dependent hydroxylase accessory protein YqeC
MLSEVLPLQSGMIVALVGAGGKTTTMFRLAAELAARGERVITTTTTHIGTPNAGQTEMLVFTTEHERWREATVGALLKHQHITVAAATTAEGKLQGIPPEWVDGLRALPGVSAVLVEADGAKGRSIKAPAAHEPVIPASADLVLLLMSAEALGQPLSDAIAHRPEQISAVTGLVLGETITPQELAALASSAHGLLKGCPLTAKAILIMTHASPPLLEAAQETARLALASGRLAGVLLCTLTWEQFLAFGDEF